MEPTFFETAEAFRSWLDVNHEQATELVVGFHKKGSGLASITWPEAVDEALCFGWIDGVTKSLGATSYQIRFTPRRPGSIWSGVNIGRVDALTKAGRMHPAGLRAFERRSEAKSKVYSFEQGDVALGEEFERQFRTHPEAWAFFQRQAPSYRKAVIWWVVSAKQEATKRRRLATLIEDSAEGRTVGQFTRRTEAG